MQTTEKQAQVNKMVVESLDRQITDAWEKMIGCEEYEVSVATDYIIQLLKERKRAIARREKLNEKIHAC